MKRPGILTILFGNPIMFLLLAGATCLFAYQFFTAGQSGWLTLLSLAVAGYSSKANDRLRSYQLWKMEWESMGGEAPKGFSLPRIPGARYVLGGAVWVCLAQGALTFAKTPGNELVLALFWLGSAVMAAVILFRVFRRFGTFTAKDAKGKRVTVGVCLPAPRQSPAMQDAYSALPEYCWAVLQRP